MAHPTDIDLSDISLGTDIEADAAPVCHRVKSRLSGGFNNHGGLKFHPNLRFHTKHDNRDEGMEELCDSALGSDLPSSDSGFDFPDSCSPDIMSVSNQFQQLKVSPKTSLQHDQNTQQKSVTMQRIEPLNRDFVKDSESTKSDEGFGSDVTASISEISLTKEAFEQNSDGDHAIHLAIIHEERYYALVFIQLVHNSDVLDVCNDLVQTPLHLSVITHQPQVTRALVLAGASLDVQDRNGNTALHIACKLGYLDCVGALTTTVTVSEVRSYLGDNRRLKFPILPQNLELKNFEGYTCAHLATLEGNGVLLEHLVKLGANINASDDKSGRRPLHFAVEANNYLLTKSMLERLNAVVDVTTFDLCTPLHIAAGRCYKELVLLLLGHRANPQALNSEGLTAFDLAEQSEFALHLRPASAPGFRINGF